MALGRFCHVTISALTMLHILREFPVSLIGSIRYNGTIRQEFCAVLYDPWLYGGRFAVFLILLALGRSKMLHTGRTKKMGASPTKDTVPGQTCIMQQNSCSLYGVVILPAEIMRTGDIKKRPWPDAFLVVRSPHRQKCPF